VVRSNGFFQMRQVCPSCGGQGERIDKPCKPCSGEGRTVAEYTVSLRIPPGVDTGTKLRSSGNGSAGRRGASAGDLYVYIAVTDHQLFERDGDDLACSVPVKFSIAALGGKIVVPKLKGKTTLNIPAGTQGGTIFRLRGEGMPPLRGSTAGDLLVRVDIDVPKKMTDKEKEALKAYAAACGDEAAPVSESWRAKFKEFFR
jgi:molecular chaperone DnaJ